MKLKITKKLNDYFFNLPKWSNIQSHLDVFPRYSPVIYSLSWFFLFLNRLFSVPGACIFIGLTPMILYSFVNPSSLNVYITLSLLAFIFIDFIIGKIFAPKLIIKRFIPSSARVNSEITIKYEVKNIGKYPAWNLSFDTMILPKRIDFVDDYANINSLAPNEHIELYCKIKVARRGKYIFAPSVASSSFPFNITKNICISDMPQHKLLIYPDYTKLNNFELPIGKKFQRQGNSFLFNIGESMDFHGCREYRPGDNPKNIHWLSSAKTGDLIVREFQEESISRIAVITDTSVGKQNLYAKHIKRDKIYPNLEKIISKTAGVIDFLTQGDLVIDLFTAGDKVYHLKAGRGQANFEAVLTILSCVKPNFENSIIKLKPSVFSMIDNIGAVVVLILEMDESRLEFIEELKQTGVNVKVIVNNSLLE